MSLCHSLVQSFALSAIVVLGAAGCAGAVESSRLEDRARRTIPVPICLKALERHGGAGVVSVLKPQDYWALILPTYDAGSNTVDRSSPDCSGRPVFSNPELAHAEGLRSGSLVVKPDDAVVQPGPDDMRIVWLRTHKFADGTAAGPLALARPREGYAEVYATGFYRGRAKDSRFSLERMGARFAVTVGDEGCSGGKPNRPCESSFQVFVMAAGKLVGSARFTLDRVDYRSVSGVPGPVQFRLTAMPTFQSGKLMVTEQLVLRDENQAVIRKSDMVRVFRLEPNGRLVTKQESLWKQVANAPPPPPPPEPDPEPPVDPKGKGKRRGPSR
ncbi:MAG: hypothetical protein JW940_26080 [Polyangiaceae bacterium]|nr:hypothetical protein [Polyangiaceae bacterium]